MDLDDFNRLFINLGKEQAEAILRQTGKTLQALVRKEDMVARVGLAKFAMLFRDADMNDATDTARRILEGIQAMIEDLIKETEIYLNKAVEAGGNQVAVKSLRKFPVEKTLSVPAALRLLEYGHTDAILPHVQSLVSQLLPLLDFLARNLEGPAAENLTTIRDRLGEGR